MNKDLHSIGDMTDDAVEQWGTLLSDVPVEALQVTHRLLWVAKAIERDVETVVSQRGLRTKGDYDTLAILARDGSAMSPSTIARLTMVTNAGMTGRIDLLESLGYIERLENSDDRRRRQIVVSDLGRAVLTELARESFRCQERVLRALSKSDRVTLAQLLRRVGEGVATRPEAG